MQVFEGKLFVTPSDLTGWGVSDNYVKKAMHVSRAGSPSWVNIPDPTDARRKLIRYDSIPTATRQKYDLPTEPELLAAMSSDTSAQVREALLSVHGSFVRSADVAWYIAKGRTPGQATSYAASAAWLRLLSTLRTRIEVRAIGAPGVETKEALKEAVLRLITDMRPQGLHRVGSISQLQQKLWRWNTAQTSDVQLATLIHGLTAIAAIRTPKANARKVNEGAKSLLMELYLGEYRTTKMNFAEIHAQYITQAASEVCRVNEFTGEVHSLPEISLTTVKAYLSSPELRPLDTFRHGSKYYRDRLRPYVLGQAPEYAWSMTSSDGQTAPFHLVINGKATWKRPVAYLIFEVHSQAIVGYRLGLQENTDLAVSAFQDMLLRSNGIMPMENQLDNFGRSAAQQVAPMVGSLHFCQPHYPQSKYAETFINAFENAHLKGIEGHVGKGIRTRQETSHRNPDKPRKAYTFQEIDQIYFDAIEAWNASTPVKSRRKLPRRELLQNVNPEAQQMDALTLATLAGSATARKIERGFVRIEVARQEMVFEVPNYTEILTELDSTWKVRVRWIPGQYERVWLYAMDRTQPSDTSLDRFLVEAPRAQATQRATAEQTADDRRILGHHLQRAERMDEYALELRRFSGRFSALTPKEAETVIDSGYTEKDIIHQAEEAIYTPPTKEPDTEKFSNAPKPISRWKRK